jgi:hypothetical protein
MDEEAGASVRDDELDEDKLDQDDLGEEEPNQEDLDEHNMGDPEHRELGPEDPVVEEQEIRRVGLLVQLCRKAEGHYGLHVGECDAPGAPDRWGPVHHVHAEGSYHYLHRAADISGLARNMRRFCRWVRRHYGGRVVELIHNPGCSVKNGSAVPASFWGPKCWRAHRSHVHLAI